MRLSIPDSATSLGPGAQGVDHPGQCRRTWLHVAVADRGPFLITEDELIDRMAVLLAGRVVEDDLARATDIARSIAARFGMGATIGPVTLEEQRLRWLQAGMACQSARDFFGSDGAGVRP